MLYLSGKGDLFGEDISRKTPPKRANGDVRALTYCDVYFITRERLQNVLHFYQEFAFKFSENLELTYDLGAHEVRLVKKLASFTLSYKRFQNFFLQVYQYDVIIF